MSQQYRVRSGGEWGRRESAVMGGALFGFAVTWALVITAPPGGLLHPFGVAISFVAGAYLLYLVFSYLKH